MTDKKEARRQSRMMALEALFAYLARDQKVSIKDSLRHVLQEVAEKKKDDFAKTLLETAAENLQKVRLIIRAYAPEFPFEKIAPINRAILILGLTEMKFLDTPPIVVINEYVELSKTFGEDKSAGFVNAVLDSFRKNVGLDSSRSKEDA